ncbi:Adaptive-response sensory-kinase SasA [Dyadobacter sp. CECT 9275]|uniref:histidine kinase n=1 Tax=Dyadobacter helix TaxID=2822344 RepID=A0A916JH18_9BACT|nr:HAMP domain-containing sensor histidine kinase [Dyadobacter sp. CECT 9275]CAG5012727.1 Adaptive-response sensory-kinase SasA [Dyadobacter sp. CECT 9275]
MKLLNYTVRSYIAYSVVILLISIPAFYLVMHRIILRTVDKALMNEKEQLMSEIKLVMTEEQLMAFKKVDGNVEIVGVDYKVSDSLYTAGFSATGNKSKDYRHLVTPVSLGDKSYKMTIHKSLDDSKDLIKSIVSVQLFLLILLLAGLILINQVSSRKLWLPFYGTLRQLQNYDLGKHHPIRTSPTDIDEFRILGETVQHLIQKNHDVYQAQKEFTENASHETQTPLAIFRSKLELLMQTEPLTGQQAQLIGDLDDASQRLAQLNKSLVLLTKIENNQYPDTEDLEIAQLARRLVRQIGFQAEEKGVQIEEDFRNEIHVTANKALIETMMINLISNAIRYNHDNGKINISVTEKVLAVSNTGIPDPLPSEKVFERFYKAGKSRQSTGLGLAIVKKICDLYGYHVEYLFQGGLHTFFIHFGKEKPA